MFERYEGICVRPPSLPEARTRAERREAYKLNRAAENLRNPKYNDWSLAEERWAREVVAAKPEAQYVILERGRYVRKQPAPKWVNGEPVIPDDALTAMERTNRESERLAQIRDQAFADKQAYALLAAMGEEEALALREQYINRLADQLRQRIEKFGDPDKDDFRLHKALLITETAIEPGTADSAALDSVTWDDVRERISG